MLVSDVSLATAETRTGVGIGAVVPLVSPGFLVNMGDEAAEEALVADPHTIVPGRVPHHIGVVTGLLPLIKLAVLDETSQRFRRKALIEIDSGDGSGVVIKPFGQIPPDLPGASGFLIIVSPRGNNWSRGVRGLALNPVILGVLGPFSLILLLLLLLTLLQHLGVFILPFGETCGVNLVDRLEGADERGMFNNGADDAVDVVNVAAGGVGHDQVGTGQSDRRGGEKNRGLHCGGSLL